MSSRFGCRATCDPGARREPIAMSEWPETSGATRGRSASRSVDRSTSMYATTSASLALQAVRRARPRPLRSRCRARTPGSSCWSRCACNHVPSVDALSTIVMRHENGKAPVRYAWSRCTPTSTARSSLKTGTTTSTTGRADTGVATGSARNAGVGPRSCMNRGSPDWVSSVLEHHKNRLRTRRRRSPPSHIFVDVVGRFLPVSGTRAGRSPGFKGLEAQ